MPTPSPHSDNDSLPVNPTCPDEQAPRAQPGWLLSTLYNQFDRLPDTSAVSGSDSGAEGENSRESGMRDENEHERERERERRAAAFATEAPSPLSSATMSPTTELGNDRPSAPNDDGDTTEQGDDANKQTDTEEDMPDDGAQAAIDSGSSGHNTRHGGMVGNDEDRRNSSSGNSNNTGNGNNGNASNAGNAGNNTGSNTGNNSSSDNSSRNIVNVLRNHNSSGSSSTINAIDVGRAGNSRRSRSIDPLLRHRSSSIGRISRIAAHDPGYYSIAETDVWVPYSTISRSIWQQLDHSEVETAIAGDNHGGSGVDNDSAMLTDAPSPPNLESDKMDEDGALTVDEYDYAWLGNPTMFLGSDAASSRVIPAFPSTFLRPGSRFTGTQQSERHEYDVQVDIQHVDLRESFLCGYLRIQGLTEEHPTLTTYFEGEIIGSKYGFSTKNKQWGASDRIDMSHWAKFPAFRPFAKQAKKGNFVIKDYLQKENLFMRWKEQFLVPDHRVRTITGASFEGFYYICFNQVEGVVSGIYFHSKSERFQQLELKHVKDKGCMSAVEFR